jgi:hypothetical protein
MSRERPIIFSGPMVRAILRGDKTQTRRVAKLTPGGHVKEPGGHRRWHPGDPGAIAACPYGKPGDVLWVREALNPTSMGFDYAADGAECLDLDEATDGQVEWWARRLGDDELTARTVPSIHMPRWAARLFLRVVAVRVERLQEITPSGAIAEGIRPSCNSMTIDCDSDNPRDDFARLWGALQAKRPAGKRAPWEANPWVWVIEFERPQAKP